MATGNPRAKAVSIAPWGAVWRRDGWGSILPKPLPRSVSGIPSMGCLRERHFPGSHRRTPGECRHTTGLPCLPVTGALPCSQLRSARFPLESLIFNHVASRLGCRPISFSGKESRCLDRRIRPTRPVRLDSNVCRCILDFFRYFLTTGFKDNPFLFKAEFLGILRIAREIVSLGLNSIWNHSHRRMSFATAFGFTDQEVESQLLRAGRTPEREAVCSAEPDYEVRLNREASRGRPEVSLRPKRSGMPGTFLELKVACPGRTRHSRFCGGLGREASMVSLPRVRALSLATRNLLSEREHLP